MQLLNRQRLTLALVVTLAGCDTSPIQGRYYKGEAWLEFRSGVVIHGELGDAVRYRVDGSKIVLSDPAGSVEGQIITPTTLRFPEGGGAMADAFAGVWIARDMSGKDILRGAEGQKAAEPLIGRWRIPGETDVFEVRADGTYTWGPRIQGSYQVLQGQKIRMTFLQEGRLSGQLDYAFAINGSMLTLTLSDGAVTTYERVG